MKEDILNNSPTVMFHGTPCLSKIYYYIWSREQKSILRFKRLIFLKRFVCPQDMIGLLRSNLGIF